MAQLSDDCFAFGGPLLSVDEAVRIVQDRLGGPDESEIVPLEEADGRVLAENVSATLSLPPFNNSAVDGYAINGDALPIGAEGLFRLADRIQAGDQVVAVAGIDEAVRIFTGAPMPDGLDTVFMQEDVQLPDESHVILPVGLKRGANVRHRGEDVRQGQLLLDRGHLIRPQDVGLIAAMGLARIRVVRRIRVAVISTGNEIVAPGLDRGAAQLYDSNRFMLIAMLKRLGCEISDFGILADDEDETVRALKRAAEGNDLVLSSGGVSTGEADFVKSAVERIGSLTFWRLAIKPGRPVAMGVIDGTPFIGLPGNPVASFVTFARLARPAIMALSGARYDAPAHMSLIAGFDHQKKPGRCEYLRANLQKGSDGRIRAVKFARDGAGLLSSLVETDGLVELPEELTRVEMGEAVAFLPWSSLL